MTTQCVFCTKFKNYNCDNCGNPICFNHVVYKKDKDFCGKDCLNEWEQQVINIEN